MTQNMFFNSDGKWQDFRDIAPPKKRGEAAEAASPRSSLSGQLSKDAR
jgi:hypothetical protein